MVISMTSGSTSFYWLAIIALAIAFVGSLLTKSKNKNSENDGKLGEKAWPVRINENLITNAERSFLSVLKIACGDAYVICPKVRLGDVVYIQKGTDAKLRQSIQNRIHQRHVDFLLLDPNTLAPVLAIELDDKSHQSAAAQSRDLVKDKALKDAGLRMLRFPARATYTLAEIEIALTGNPAPSEQTQSDPAPETEPATNRSNTVLCPKCNTPMVIRQARKGSKSGTTFYGCGNYPHCREILPIE